MANLVGVTTGVIAEWEADEAAPSITELSRLSKALSVSSDELLEDVAEAVEPKPGSIQPIPTPQATSVASITPKKKSKKALWIALAAVACCLVAVAAFLLLGDGSNGITEPVAFSQNSSAIEAADASVVKIYCYDYDGNLAATGSGFIAFDGKTVITNHHVMTSAYTCKISTNQDISYDVAGIYCYSEKQDIAILQLAKDTGLQPLTLGDSTVIKKGETVVAIGSPLGIKNTVSTGVLSGRIMDADMDVLQFTAPISSGSSGGALFDDKGNVIGITFASIIDGQNLNLAIPVELATNLYKSKGTVKKVSAIYLEENPHVAYLDSYKNVPTVTIDDLQKNPTKYAGQNIKLIAYVSSRGDGLGYRWDAGSWFLSKKENITLDYEYDRWTTSPGASGIMYPKCPVIECSTAPDKLKYADESIVAGDQIEIIAYFDYHKTGEKLFPDNPESDLCWSYDGGSLDAIVIWKKG